MDGKKIGQYLTCLRKYYRITQDELAGYLSVTRQAVSKWETGSTVPDIDMLLKLSQLYGITINEICEADVSRLQYRKEISLLPQHHRPRMIRVIGCGRWGSFLAWYLERLGHQVTLQGRKSSQNMQQLMNTRRNEYLTLPETITLADHYEGICEAEIILISVGAQNLQTVVQELAAHQLEQKTIVLCMKGLEMDTGRRLSQIVTDILSHSNKLAVWLGPGHVQEFYRGIPNCMVIDSHDEILKNDLIQCFSSDLIRFYYGTDMIGNEIGAAAKNVIGIAGGILEGLEMSSLKGALMARGTREIARLIATMGGKESSAYGLCHLGDYEATLFSEHSQNRTYGKNVALARDYHKLAEGYYTAKALHNLSKSYGVELPICEAVYQVLYQGKNPRSTFERLFQRSLKNEF